MNWGGESWTPNPGNSHIASTSCPSLYLSFSSPRLSPLEIGPLNTAKGLGSAVSSPSELSQRGLGQSPNRKWIWYILALKSDIWWTGTNFTNFSENYRTYKPTIGGAKRIEAHPTKILARSGSTPHDYYVN